MKMKYIMIGRVPHIFPESEPHLDVARRLTGNMLKKVTSAGFCAVGYDPKMEHDAWTCWGESISLNIKSQEKDAMLFNIAFRANPY